MAIDQNEDIIEDVEDNNNNGDVNGNSEMVDLHSRRLQEEREREQLVLQRNDSWIRSNI